MSDADEHSATEAVTSIATRIGRKAADDSRQVEQVAKRSDDNDAKARPVRERVLYGLSLPERALRSTAGVLGGTLRESAALLLPEAFRNAKSYQVFVGQMLDFLAEDVGRVGERGEAASNRGQDYVARKTVGNFIDVASLATVHLSPMLLLALVSDLAYGSQAYLRELAEELQRQGVIADASSVDKVDDLLDQVADFSSRTASAFDQPPLSVDGLKETVQRTRDDLQNIDIALLLPQAELATRWQQMKDSARRQGVSPFQISGLMTLASLDTVGKLGNGALSTVQAAGTLLSRHVLDHYREVHADIDQRGFHRTLAATARPYLQAAWGNFSPRRATLTEEFLGDDGGASRALGKARRWLGGRRP